ncbi:MAG: urease accessory protein UreE [Xenococcaceae cyanobacterium MO_167.B27]|nr:urease accessory protein UreE [Xenococcaceae cyanobacterium MO_167.B27]
MTVIAKQYLGNINQNYELVERVNQAKKANKYLEIEIQESDRIKGRIFTKSVSGVTIGIIKNRELLLKTGDILETELGDLILIKLQEEKAMVLTITAPVTKNNALDLVRLGHLLGNNHYPIKIQDNKIYVRLVTNPKVMEKNMQQLNITGLEITYTTESINYDNQDLTHHH